MDRLMEWKDSKALKLRAGYERKMRCEEFLLMWDCWMALDLQYAKRLMHLLI